MQPDHYREVLVQTVNKLADIRGDGFDALFGLAMAGELKDWSDSVPVGESFTFTKDIFEGCDDTNIQLLTRLLNSIECTYESLCNLNNLQSLPAPDDNG